MENATKALMIAAGVMIAMMVLSLLMIMYNEISSYYQEKQNTVMVEQTSEFNNTFSGYDRENIRGTDLISLMNKVIDYNERQSYQEGTNYKRIEVTIKIDKQYLDDFQYSEESYKNANIESIFEKDKDTIITNTTGNGTNSQKDKQLIEITSIEDKLIEKANNKGISGLNSNKLASLSSNIGNIIINENSDSDYDRTNRDKRAKLLKSILGVDISNDKEKIKVIKEITYSYYEYTQFKRAHFHSTGFKNDPQTGRICEMNFEISTKDGSVVFN